MGTLVRFAEESWPALSCRESSLRLGDQSLGPTAEGTSEETDNGKQGKQIDMTVALKFPGIWCIQAYPSHRASHSHGKGPVLKPADAGSVSKMVLGHTRQSCLMRASIQCCWRYNVSKLQQTSP